MSIININGKLEENLKSIRMKSVFHKLNIKRELLNKSFHRQVDEKRKKIKRLYGETGVENKKDLITFLNDTNFYKSKKKYIQKYILRAIRLNEKNKEQDHNFSIENSFNLTNTYNHSLPCLTERDYSINNLNNNNSYNNFLLIDRKKSKFLTNRNLEIKNNKIKESKSFYNKKIKLVLGIKNKNSNDFEPMNLTNYSSKERSLDKTSRTNTSEEKRNIFSKDYFKINTDEITQKIRKIIYKNLKTKNKLNYILKDDHYCPFVPNSLNIDYINIANKQFKIERPGKYKFIDLDNEKKFKEKLKNYWIEKEPDKGIIALIEKHNQMKLNIQTKIHKDIIKAKKLNLDLKFGPNNLEFYKKFLHNSNQLVIDKPNVNK